MKMASRTVDGDLSQPLSWAGSSEPPVRLDRGRATTSGCCCASLAAAHARRPRARRPRGVDPRTERDRDARPSSGHPTTIDNAVWVYAYAIIGATKIVGRGVPGPNTADVVRDRVV